MIKNTNLLVVKGISSTILVYHIRTLTCKDKVHCYLCTSSDIIIIKIFYFSLYLHFEFTVFSIWLFSHLSNV